jgi:hypothetical protein
MRPLLRWNSPDTNTTTTISSTKARLSAKNDILNTTSSVGVKEIGRNLAAITTEESNNLPHHCGHPLLTYGGGLSSSYQHQVQLTKLNRDHTGELSQVQNH